MTRAAREDTRPSRRATRQVENSKRSSQDREAEEEEEGEGRLKNKVQSNQKSELKLSLK